MPRTLIILFLFFPTLTTHAQPFSHIADSIRVAFHIPELGYAVVSSDSVPESGLYGTRKADANLPARPEDRFRIGSNTKAVTGMLAALLVKQGKLSWETRFFDLFPEMKAGSRKEYHNLTLLNLLSFRARLLKYTYTDVIPIKGQFTGTEAEQRYQFARWFFKQKPVKPGKEGITLSNLGYIAAGLMMEKLTGKPYKQLATEWGKENGISFFFGQPNLHDTLQVWGHNAQGIPEAPADNYKLEWLLPAGNITMTLADYTRFIQLQLKGLNGRSELLTADQFRFLHYGLPTFSVGWFRNTDERWRQYSWNVGNPGTFLSKVYVFAGNDRAFILFANIQSDEADLGMGLLYERLKAEYIY